MSVPSPSDVPRRRFAVIALAGNPNSGKTTLFNALTGSRQKVGNYAGVTVERKEGRWRPPGGDERRVIDLPGIYSLDAHSPEESIAGEVLRGGRADVARPEAVIAVVDATNLERNLYLVAQLMETGLPLVVALNMMDMLEEYRLRIDVEGLSQRLGVPVVGVVAREGKGLDRLADALEQSASTARPWRLDAELEREIAAQAHRLGGGEHEAVLALCASSNRRPELADRHERWRALGIDFYGRVIEARYRWIHSVTDGVLVRTGAETATRTDRLDAVFLHRFWGYAIFLGLMALVFQSVFSWAAHPMEAIDTALGWIGGWLSTALPEGLGRSLLIDGVLGGVGAVVVFLPQIALLFLFIGVLEDSGYMARAAFLMDRLMARVGLSGHSFIPMLSSFACAIPGVMATRTIANPRDRLITILVAPLMTCSARLPVYALMIAALVPDRRFLGLVSLKGLALLSLYFIGVAAALVLASLFRRTLLRGRRPTLILELPAYRRPQWRSVLRNVANRAMSFLRRAGTVILSVSILMWLLLNFPRVEAERFPDPRQRAAAQLRESVAGRLGRAIEPAIAPLGFDWKIGVSLISTFAAREVFIGTLGTIYSVADADETSPNLKDAIRRDTNPRTGGPLFSVPMAAALMIFYVFACQCLATVAVVRRETNGWRWPLFLLGYSYALGYLGALAVYQGLWALGWR